MRSAVRFFVALDQWEHEWRPKLQGASKSLVSYSHNTLLKQLFQHLEASVQGPPARQGKTCTGLSAPANMSSLFAFVKSRLDYLDLVAEMGRDASVI